ncbi:MAG TPA: efflux RND transporter periplasmic adaptor subunit [Cytophagaceae bacterium]|nr:efflux RND transporter periplasmic adaptor subunit [Cytophagaceae bacterium]
MKENKKRNYIIISVLVLLVLAGLFFIGLIPKLNRNKKLEEASENRKTSLIPVQAIQLQLSKDTFGVALPGSVKAFEETFIYARVNGYIKKWYTDIGSPVHEGQLLAEIETPELDQNLVQAKANLEYARQNYKRIENVTLPGAVSKQEIDQYKSAYEANKAIVGQFEAQESFKKIKAPFAGIITARNIDIGNLISAGSTQPMFQLQYIDVLRIFINVPQNYVTSISPGLLTNVFFEKFPGPSVKGKVVRTANSLDPASRTLLTEVQVKNYDHKLMPGMYVQVKFDPLNNSLTLLIPANTLLIRTEGPQVAVVGPDSIISIRQIKIGRDYGKYMEVISGLNGNERLVANPTDKLRDGLKVNVISARKQTGIVSENRSSK